MNNDKASPIPESAFDPNEKSQIANEVTAREIFDAFEFENGRLQEQVYHLSRRISKFEWLFNLMFEEEAKERLLLDHSPKTEAAGMSLGQRNPMHELRMKLEAVRFRDRPPSGTCTR